MLDRLPRILRLVIPGVGALLVLRLAILMFRADPLQHLRVPRPPHWRPSDEPAGATNLAVKLIPPTATNLAGTNLATTNLMATNLPGATQLGTHLRSPNLTGTNVAGTNIVGTNVLGTNLTGSARPPGPGNPPPGIMPPGTPPGMPFGGPGSLRGGPGAVKPPRPLSPLIQARIDRITQSEIFAPVMRPPPLALFGIAGRDAFIRTPNGQTLMLRVGDEKDGIKLLLIGTNRVLLEQGGEKKELTIFSGFGSESLLPK